MRLDGDGCGFPFRIFLLSQKRLEELDIRGLRDLAYVVEAVTAFGPGLKRLGIDVDVTRETTVARMFEATGPTLAALDISVSRNKVDDNARRFDLKRRFDFCPRITSLVVEYHGRVKKIEEPRQDLTLSYGSQLKFMAIRYGTVNVEFLNQLLTRLL